MKQVNIQEIIIKARQFKDQNLNWHFHILTPECQLNETNSYALILEDNTHNKVFTYPFTEKPMDLGKELLQLLHGKTILQKEEIVTKKISPEVEKILKKAKELNSQGIFWHHHMIFPDCTFNKHKGKWVLILEDQESGDILGSLTETEPKEDLKLIETLFYQQTKK